MQITLLWLGIKFMWQHWLHHAVIAFATALVPLILLSSEKLLSCSILQPWKWVSRRMCILIKRQRAINEWANIINRNKQTFQF